jgi:hypothetical protein
MSRKGHRPFAFTVSRRPEGNWRLSAVLQLPVLLLGELQSYSAAAVFDGIVERLAPFEIELVASVLRHFDQLRRIL